MAQNVLGPSGSVTSQSHPAGTVLDYSESPLFGPDDRGAEYGQQGGGGWWDSFKKFFLGTPEGQKLLERLDPTQRSALDKLLQGSLDTLQNPTQGFEGIEQQARSDFETKTIPSILQRFSSFGSNRDSSNLRGSLTAGASELEKGLGALKAQYGLENKRIGLGQAALGLQPKYESIWQQRQPGFGEEAGKTLIKLIPYLI